MEQSNFFQSRYGKLVNRCRNGNARYRGLPYLSKEEWQEFLRRTYGTRRKLYAVWEASGFKLRLTPTVDRKDSKLGYLPENIRWLPYHENTGRAFRNKDKCKKGHPWTKANTYVYPNGVWKHCRICHRIAENSNRAKERIADEIRRIGL